MGLRAETFEHLAAVRLDFRYCGSMDVYWMLRCIAQSVVKCIKQPIRN